MKKTEKAVLILQKLHEVIPTPETELTYTNPWELLVSVVLSAQCTDKRVNLVTPAFFERFPDAVSLSLSDFDIVFPYLKSISYPNNKTKHLIETSKILVDKFLGAVPREFDELLKLPGVGRKTANVINSVLYGEPRMPVDTHVFRVSKRLGLATGKTPEKVEQELVKIIPPGMIPIAHHLLILHGRYTCIARKPLCDKCILIDLCGFGKKFLKKQKI